MVAIIVIASVGLLGVAKLYGNTGVGLSRATETQVAAQLAQDCAERVLQKRRDFGVTLTSISASMCSPSPAPYIPTVSWSDKTGSDTDACPLNVACRDVTVTICSVAGTPCPATAALPAQLEARPAPAPSAM